MKSILLVGAGDQGRVTADLAEQLGFEHIAFVDDRWPILTENMVWPVLGGTKALERLRKDHDTALVSIGSNKTRVAFHLRLVTLGFTVPTLIHPSAVISRYARVGIGTVILANAVVNAFAEIGDAVILNTSCSVDHDCIIERGVHIAPGARLAGTVFVGDTALIGLGAAVRENIRIGRGATIGVGSAVLSDVADGVVAIGNPARPR